MPGSHEDTTNKNTSPNSTSTEDLSLAFQAFMDATCPDRQRDARRFIEAFTQTVVAAHHPSSSDRTHLTWPPSRLDSCLPLGTLRITRPRPLRVSSTQRSFPSPQDHTSHVDRSQTGRHLTHAVSGAAQLEGASSSRSLLAIHSRLRGRGRARTATAHETTRLDARRDSGVGPRQTLGIQKLPSTSP